jgi:hypothetical protein
LLLESVKAAEMKILVSAGAEEAHRKLISDLEELEEKCAEYYLRKEVHMTFCTSSISAYGLLQRYYKPRFILQDDATDTSILDAVTSLAAFVELVELLILAGDHKNYSPKVLFYGFNEFADLLRRPLSELTLVNDLFKASFIEL